MDKRTKEKNKNKSNSKSIGKNSKKELNFQAIILPALLVIITLVVYAKAYTNGLANNWDDNMYLLDNSMVQQLNWQNFLNYFNQYNLGNYHPLTLLSLGIDFALFGMNPTAFHTENILLHAINVLLVFYFARIILKNNTASFVVALLFAVHPMHTESVAWVTERKDVLFFFFFMAGMIVYSFYAQGKLKKSGYIIAFFLFLLSLLSKSTGVIFPFILLLTDYILKRPMTKIAWLEKIPYLLLAIAIGIVTIYAQAGQKALNESTVSVYTFFDRIFIASYALLYYIIKTIVPFGLAAMHYYPGNGMQWYFYASLPVVIALVVMIILQYKKRPYIFYGGMFFIISMALMLQLIPVGYAIVAERYVYLGHVGFFICIGWFIAGMPGAAKPVKGTTALVISILACIIFSVISWEQNKTWKDGVTIFDKIVSQYPDYGHAYMARGNAKTYNNDIQGALEDYNKALSVKFPHKFAITYCNRGNCYYRLNDIDRALENYNKAIEVDSTYFICYTNRGIIYYTKGDFDRAIAEYDHALRINHEHNVAYYNKGIALRSKKDYQSAIQCFNQAISLNARDDKSYENRGQTYFEENKFEQACNDFETAYKINPSNSNALVSAASCKYRMGKTSDACNDWRTAQSLGNKQASEYLQYYCK